VRSDSCARSQERNYIAIARFSAYALHAFGVTPHPASAKLTIVR